LNGVAGDQKEELKDDDDEGEEGEVVPAEVANVHREKEKHHLMMYRNTPV
jgi:hypothetical protein